MNIKEGKQAEKDECTNELHNDSSLRYDRGELTNYNLTTRTLTNIKEGR